MKVICPPKMAAVLNDSSSHLLCPSPVLSRSPSQLLYLPSLGACVLAACILRRDYSLTNAQPRTPADKDMETVTSNATNRNGADRDGNRIKIFADTPSLPGKQRQQKRTPPPAVTSSPFDKAPASGNSVALLEAPERSGTNNRHRPQISPSLSTPLFPAPRGPHQGKGPPHGSAAAIKAKGGERPSSFVVPDSTPPPGRRVSHGDVGNRKRKNKARLSGLAEAAADNLLVDTPALGRGTNSGNSQSCACAEGKQSLSSSPASRARKRQCDCEEKLPGGSQAIGSRRRKLLKTTVAMGLLAAWAAFFSGRTLSRCKDWKSERALFESALRVCPNGIKTLNNLASGMLNVVEAPRAERLLRRAIEVSMKGARGTWH